jgi:hypothetical protein
MQDLAETALQTDTGIMLAGAGRETMDEADPSSEKR